VRRRQPDSREGRRGQGLEGDRRENNRSRRAAVFQLTQAPPPWFSQRNGVSQTAFSTGASFWCARERPQVPRINSSRRRRSFLVATVDQIARAPRGIRRGNLVTDLSCRAVTRFARLPVSIASKKTCRPCARFQAHRS